MVRRKERPGEKKKEEKPKDRETHLHHHDPCTSRSTETTRDLEREAVSHRRFRQAFPGPEGFLRFEDFVLIPIDPHSPSVVEGAVTGPEGDLDISTAGRDVRDRGRGLIIQVRDPGAGRRVRVHPWSLHLEDVGVRRLVRARRTVRGCNRKEGTAEEEEEDGRTESGRSME